MKRCFLILWFCCAAAQLFGQTYVEDVRPIFIGKCARCHNEQAQFLPNWLDYKQAFADRREIKRRVWDSWQGTYYKQTMPAGNSPECSSITPQERKTIRDWVNAGGVLGSQTPGDNKTTPQQIEAGKKVFAVICSTCHQPDGMGIPGRFPPLARSDFLNQNKERAIGILIHGKQGPVTVNGETFNASMPSLPLNDDEIASALTFVYSAFGNSGQKVLPSEVAKVRQKPFEEPSLITHNEQTTPFE